MSATKLNRIEIRSSDEEKKMFEEAASLAHMDLSEFIRFSAHFYAKSIRKEYELITLSKDEGIKFLKVLDNPPKPNQKLKDAMKRHRKQQKNVTTISNDFDK